MSTEKPNGQTGMQNPVGSSDLVRPDGRMPDEALAATLRTIGLRIEGPTGALPNTIPWRCGASLAGESSRHLKRSFLLLGASLRWLLLSLKTHAIANWQYWWLYRVFGRLPKRASYLYTPESYWRRTHWPNDLSSPTAHRDL